MPPKVGLVEEKWLAKWESQYFEPLMGEFDIRCFVSKRKLYDISDVTLPVTELVRENEAGSFLQQKRLNLKFRRDSRRLGFDFGLAGLEEHLGECDIIHTVDTCQPFMLQCVRARLRHNRRLVVSSYETLPFNSQRAINHTVREIDAEMREHTDLFLAYTQRVADRLAMEGVPDKRIRVIPAAVDPARFVASRPPAEVRAAWGVTPDAFVVLYVGRLVFEKGVLDLLRAAAHIRRLRPGWPVHLVFCGTGPLQSEIERMVSASGLDNIHLLGFVPYMELPNAYAAADLVVLPSIPVLHWEEQFGRVLIEAMACGTPLLVSASGGMPEVVGDCGAIVPPGDYVTLAKAIVALADDPARRREMARRGLERVRERYSCERVAAQIADAYRHVLGR